MRGGTNARELRWSNGVVFDTGYQMGIAALRKHRRMMASYTGHYTGTLFRVVAAGQVADL